MGDDDVKEEDRSQDLGPHFVRACAIETHVKISHEPFYTEIHRKNAAAQSEHPDQCTGLYSYRKNPSCVDTFFFWKNCCGTSGNGMNSGMETPPRDDVASGVPQKNKSKMSVCVYIYIYIYIYTLHYIALHCIALHCIA